MCRHTCITHCCGLDGIGVCFRVVWNPDAYRSYVYVLMFAWLISHQPAVLFSQNKPVTNNQPAVLYQPPTISQQHFSLRTNQHQPSAKRTGCLLPAGHCVRIARTRTLPLSHRVYMYSLRFHIRSRLVQRHGHQSTTLTSLFYKNLYWKVIYVYSYESNFQDKSIYMIFTFSNSTN
jgi:5-methylcytosine-specific restriction endonuclease McrA